MSKIDSSSVLEEVRWLANTEAVREAWTKDHQFNVPGVDAVEYYSILFDDNDIENVTVGRGFTDHQVVLIKEFARALRLAAEKDHSLYDASRLLGDPHFAIAQSIARLV